MLLPPFKFAASLFAALLIAAQPLSAADVSWVATTNNGDWANTNNWSGGVLPGVSDNAFLTNGRQAWLRLTNTSPTISNLTVSNSGVGLRLLGNTGVLSVSGAITVTSGRIETSLAGGNASNSTYYAIQTPLIDATNATLELSPPGTATWLTAGPGSTWNFKSIDVNIASSIADASAGANFRINGATVNVGFDNVTAYGLMLSRNSNAVSSLLVESGTLTATRIGIGRQQNNFQNAGTGSVQWSGGTIGNLAGRDLLINSYDITDNYGLAINLTNAGDKTLSVESGRIARIGVNARNFNSTGAIAGTNTSGAYFTGSGGRLVIDGGGTVRLYQSNSYTGPVKIDNGTLTLVSGSETFESTTGTYSGSIAPSALEIATNGTLDLQNGTGLGGSGTVSFTGGLLRFSSNSVADLSARISGSTGAIRIDTGTNTVTFASGLAANNTGGLTKTGNGTLALAASSSYSGGTLISAGTLLFTNGGSVAGNITNNAALAINRTDASTLSNAVSGTGALTKAGIGTLTLSGNNTYTGATTVAGGTLRIDANSRLGNTTNTLAISNAGVLEVTAAGTLTNAITIGAGNGVLANSSAGALVIAGNVDKNGTIFTSRSGTGTNVFTGFISGTNANSDFVVDGGTTVFSNAMTYNGPTIITNGGTLVLGVDDAMPSGSDLILGGGTFLVDVLNYNADSSLSMGTLTLTAGSTIDLGGFGASGDRNLVFADSSGVVWATNTVLTITNWQGVANQQSDVTKLLFGTGGLTSTQLAQIRFADQNIDGGQLLGAQGELAPIPEAPVVWGAAALAAFIFWRERRRLAKAAQTLLHPLPQRLSRAFPRA